MQKIFLVGLLLVCSGCAHSEDTLVVEYGLEDDTYLYTMAKKCLLEHRRVSSNTVDQTTGLPFSEIDTLGVGLPFVVDTVGVAFSSSKNEIHWVWSMSCSFERYTGALRSLSSISPRAPERNRVEYPKYDTPKQYQGEEGGRTLMFGIKLDYPEFIRRYKHESTNGDL